MGKSGEGETRERVLAGAVEAYGVLDPSFVSIEEITLRARVSRRTVYAHFESLTALRYEAWDRIVAVRLTELATDCTDMRSADPFRDGLLLLARKMHEHRTEFRFVFGEIRREGFDDERRERLFEQVRTLWMNGHNEAHRAGTTPRPMTMAEAERNCAMLVGTAQVALDHGSTLESVEARLLGFLETYRIVYPHHPAASLMAVRASGHTAAAVSDR